MDSFISHESDYNSSPSSYSSSRRAISDGEIFATVATSRPKRSAGRRKFRETRHPVYKGVRRRNGERWVCEVREPKKQSRIWLGTFPTPEMAARAHDVAALALRGPLACLNFEDSAWRLPVPSSGNAKDIQKAAAEAAEAFRPPPPPPSSETVVESPEEEELLFPIDDMELGMPALLANMAEGLLLSPPRVESGCGSNWDDVETYADVSLWSYSV